MRRNLAFGSAAAAIAALVVSNPMIADAARLITSADIANGTIQSKDIDNKTIRAKDIAPQGVKGWNIANGTVASKDIKNGTIKAEDIDPAALPVSAYARVTADNTAATLDTERSARVTSVTRTAPGTYCLELAAGIDRSVAVMAQAEGGTANAGNDEAAWSGNCGTNGVQVTTEQQSVNASNALVSTPVNTVSFNVLVP